MTRLVDSCGHVVRCDYKADNPDEQTLKHTNTWREHASLVRHQTLPLIFVIQKKAFSNITVSHFGVTAALFSFPAANDKGVASSLDTGCPQRQNRSGLAHSQASPYFAQDTRKSSSALISKLLIKVLQYSLSS